MNDILGRPLNLYDIVVVVSANGKMELALIVNTVHEYGLPYPVIRRFNEDYELRKKEVVYKQKTIFIANNSVPAGFYKKKLQFMEGKC